MTDIEIVNAAITQLGCKPISQLQNPATNDAKIAKANYVPARDFVNADREWKFALDRMLPALDAGTPAYRYAYRYVIPSGVLKVVRIYSDPDENTQLDDWDRQGQYIVTNNAPPIYALALIRVPEAQWSPGAVEALIEYLKHKYAVPLTENRQASLDAYEMYLKKVGEAAGTDSMQGRSPTLRIQKLPGRIR